MSTKVSTLGRHTQGYKVKLGVWKGLKEKTMERKVQKEKKIKEN